ncbi:proline-specific peptidase [Hymenopellis radicata]|nr:proline-specific peptidase [Hymenopellis radicata]
METTGTVEFIVAGETYHTWYKIFGDVKVSGHRPLVALHGGPGTVYTRLGIPVILYDQLGNGQSSHIHDKPKSFWSPDLFCDELENLLSRLGIGEDYDILGQSWGGMLAAYYAATRRPAGLRRLVISNSPASMELFMEGANKLLDRFPPEQAALVREYESKDDLTLLAAPEYESIIMEWCKRHICTLDPWPEELMDTFAAQKEDPTVHRALMGGFNFKLVGSLKMFSVIDVLHNISCPTLVISAAEDEIRPDNVRPFFDRIPKVKWVELVNSSHLGQFEEPEKYFEVVCDFLK